MRPGQQNKRMRGRGRKGPNPLSRSYESNGPDVKIRGNAQHIAEKYAALARDASASGDYVIAENYLQHAEHYNRIIAAAQAQFQQHREERDNRVQDEDDEETVPSHARGDYQDRNDYNGRGDRDDYRDRGQRDNRNGRGGEGGRGDRWERRERVAADGTGPQPFVGDEGADRTAKPNGADRAESAAEMSGSAESEGRDKPRTRRARRQRIESVDVAEEAAPANGAVNEKASEDAPAEVAPPRRAVRKSETAEAEDKPKRRPGRPRKKKPEDAENAASGENGDQGELPDFLLASNG